jgi:hypothetical protein
LVGEAVGHLVEQVERAAGGRERSSGSRRDSRSGGRREAGRESRSASGVGCREDGAEWEGRERERRVGRRIPVEEKQGGGRREREREEAGQAAWGERVRGQRGAEAGEVERRKQGPVTTPVMAGSGCGERGTRGRGRRGHARLWTLMLLS